MAVEMWELVKCHTACVRTCKVSLLPHDIFTVWFCYPFYGGEWEAQREKLGPRASSGTGFEPTMAQLGAVAPSQRAAAGRPEPARPGGPEEGSGLTSSERTYLIEGRAKINLHGSETSTLPPPCTGSTMSALWPRPLNGTT